MADRYWVGGSGTWDNTDTTHWSSTSGGVGGASTPTSVDAVFFDINSSAVAYSVTLGAVDISCGDITIDNPSSGNISIVDQSLWYTLYFNFHGSFTNNVGAVISNDFKRYKRFLGTGTHYLKFGGGSPFSSGDVYLQGSGTYNLTDAANWGILNVYHSNGTYNTNGYTHTGYRYNGSTVNATINMSNSTFNLQSGGFTSSNIVNAGTSLVRIFNAGTCSTTANLYDVKFDANSGNNYFYIASYLLCNKFILGTQSNTSFLNIRMSADLICSEFTSQPYAGSVSGHLRSNIHSNQFGVNRTINATTNTAKNVTFSNITFTNYASDASWGDAENNSNIGFTAGINVYYVGGPGGNVTIESGPFGTVSGGAPDVTLFPRPQDTLIIDNNSPSSIDADAGYYQYGSINASARTSAFNFLIGSTNTYVFGNLACNSDFTFTSTSTSRYINFFGSSNQTIDANGGNIQQVRISKSDSNATVTLLSDVNFRATSTASVSIWMLNGIFDANGYNVDLDRFYTSTSGLTQWHLPSAKSTKVYMGEGNWYLNGTGTGTSTSTGAPWNDTTSNNTVYAETSTLHLTSDTASELRTRGQNLNNIVKSTGVGQVYFQITISINELISSTVSDIVINTGVVLNLNYAEIAGNLSGGGTFNWTGNRYFNGQNINVTSVNATFPAGFPAGPMFVGSAGNVTSSTGWTIADAPVRYWVGGAGSWGETTHWSTTSGGTSGASIPDATSECIIDNNSGGGTILFGSTNYNPTTFFNLYGNNQSASIALSQSGTVICGGDYVLDNSVNKSGNGNNYFTSARFGNRISVNNDQMYVVYLNGGGSYYLDSAIYASFQSSNAFNIYDVDFYSNGYSIQSSVQIDRQYNRTVDLTNSYIRCFLDWRITNTGTGTITLTGTQIRFGGYTSSSFYGGGLNYPFVENQNGSHITLNYIDDNSYDRLDLPGCSNFGRGGTMTFTGTHTINDNGQVTFKSWSGSRRMLTKGGMTFGSNVTITAGDHDFQNFTATGATITGTRLGDVGGNTGVVFDTPKTVYYDGATGYNSATINLANSFYKKLNGYDLANASYDNINFSVQAQETTVFDLYFKEDGATMYTVGWTQDGPREYSLSTPWDISTASYVQGFSIAAQDTVPTGLFFKPDGTKMYVSSQGVDSVHEYNLATAWNISTASYVQSFSIAAQEATPRGLFFKSDGTKMYFLGTLGGDVNEYNLSTAWDISTASFSTSFALFTQTGGLTGLVFNPDGTKMFITGTQNDAVYSYTLSTAWAVSTTSYDGVSFSVAAQDTAPTGLFFKSDGTKMYITGSTNNTIYQYSTGSASTSSDNYPLPQDTLIFETPAGAGTHNLELPFYTTPMLDFSNVNTGDIQIYHDYTYDYLYMKGVVLGPNARYKQKTTTDNRIVFVLPEIPKELSGDLEGTHLKLLTTEEFTFSTFAPENLYIQGNAIGRHTNATGFAININNCQLTNFNGSPEAGNWYVGNSTISGTSIGLIPETEEDSKSGSPLMMF